MNIFTKSFRLTFVFILLTHFAFSSNIAIIESQSFHALQVMDDNWKSLAEGMGHSTAVLPQTTLDDIANLNGYDMLFVTNGLINLSSARQNTIQQFVAQGGSLYIQSEYLATQPGNEAFENIVNNLGGNFSWTGEMNGNLIPMNIIGDLTSNYTDVSVVEHFWYGAYGNGGDNIIPFLEYDDKHFGFIYCPSTATQGKIITTSDQDWVRLGYTEDLAKNILAYLDADDTFVAPSVFVTVSNSQPCENEPVTFTANIGSTDATVSYQWHMNGAPIAGATSASYTSIFDNGDKVNCIITFVKGCGKMEVITPEVEVLTVFPLVVMPTLSIETSTTTICDNEMITATATATNLQGLNNVSYQWQLNNQNVTDATDTTYQTNTLNNGDVLTCQIQFIDPCSGANIVTSNDLTFSVTPTETPTLTISSDLTNTCAGEEVTFTATGTFLGNAPSYQWTVNGNNVGTNAPTYTTNTLTNGQVVSCIATSNSSCALTPTATANEITVNVSSAVTPEVIILASATTICDGESITFQATGSNLGTAPQYQWQVNGVNVGSNSNIFTTSSLTNGQTITCWAVSSEACVTDSNVESTPVEITVTTDATPIVEITASQTVVCEGGNVTFTATGDHLGTNPQYQWMINGTTTGNNSSIFNTTLTSEQTISCIVTTNTSCGGQNTINSNEIQISIGDISVQVITNQPESCDNANGAIEVIAGGGLEPYTYTWNNNATNNLLTNISAGEYSVLVTDANGCTATLEVTVDNSFSPEIAEVEVNHITCHTAGGSAKITMEDETQDYFYIWKNDNDEIIANTPEVHNLQEGLYIVEVIDVFGCSSSEEFYIQPTAPVLAEVLEERKIQLGEEAQLKVVTNVTGATFEWEANPSLSCLDCMTPTVNPTETTTYFVTVTTAEGCAVKAQVTIWVQKPREVYVPNAFSPNSDGVNDVFAIYGGTDVAKVKTLKVFNRWGETVFANDDFEVNDETQGWEGRVGNKILSSGVYVYFAEIEFVDGQVYTYEGDVTITE